jgi:hypothetical protein
MDRLFSTGYEVLVTVQWWVQLATWSFVFKGLDRDLVSFPIEKFRYAVTVGVARRNYTRLLLETPYRTLRTV